MAHLAKLTGVLDLIKAENSIFVLPFTYIGMLFAPGLTAWKVVLITLALLTARGAAFAANRYIGRDYDVRNPIKKNWSNVRLYSKGDILAIFVVLSAVFLSCAYALNSLSLVCAPVILALVILEPYTKRYTEHRHFSMALVIGLGILGGYIGAAGAFPQSPALYLLLLGYVFFSGGSDMVISIPNAKFDKANGLKTYPSVYGVASARTYSFYSHLASAVLFFAFGSVAGSVQVMLAAVLTAIIFVLEDRKSYATDEKSIASTFFYYNAAVSMVMLLAVMAFKFA